ncbi:MAG TPA: IPT/TIG domain-containing protein [Candidatus Sulfopaludibacter sp.]|nr:IPT/TIG domain-containing protein [Candidatus Sulfopaludibacter sp.]
MCALKLIAAVALLPQAMAFYGRIDNPAPVLAGISPNKIVARGAGQVLAISGRNFLSSSTVLFNGVQRPTKYVSPVRLTIVLSPSDLYEPGTYPVVVVNPPPGGGNSATGHLLVQPPASRQPGQSQ